MTDVFSREKRSEVMSKIRSKWTKQEKEFLREYSEAIPHPAFPHSPDFLLNGKAIFLDSGFWHGYVSKKKLDEIGDYWRSKLIRNIIRDECADAFYGDLACRVFGFRSSLSMTREGSSSG